jgi:hypothetical protein
MLHKTISSANVANNVSGKSVHNTFNSMDVVLACVGCGVGEAVTGRVGVTVGVAVTGD